MKAWLFKAGATFPKLKLLYLEPGYRGTIATKHINVTHYVDLEKVAYCLCPKVITYYSLNGQGQQI